MPSVSIVISPRERYGCIDECLQSLFATISEEVVVHVFDPGSPNQVKENLRALQRQRPFELHLLDYPIKPNEARNMGLDLVQTKYVVLADNDMVFVEGWLDHLLHRAVTDQADLVAPLIFAGSPLNTNIHHAGGRLIVEQNLEGQLEVRESHQAMFAPLTQLDQLVPDSYNEVCEFHCFLGRTEFVKRIAPFDERMVSREQIDCALRAKYLSGKVRFERKAMVNYMSDKAYHESDLAYLSFRWADEHVNESLDAFIETWGVSLDRSRILNQWIGEKRYRSYVSCFPEDAIELGKDAFKKVHMETCEPIFLQQAKSKRDWAGIGLPLIPEPLDKLKVRNMLLNLAMKNAAAAINMLPNSKPNNDTKKVVAGMATMPTRLASLVSALATVLPQVDILYLFLDRFEQPFPIDHPKIIILRSQQLGDLRANGKFAGLLERHDPVYFASVDDDVVYPPDYIERLLSRYQGSPIGVHGSVFKNRNHLLSYLHDRRVSNRCDPLEQPERADVLGTCTSFFNTADLSFDVRDWQDTNMVDLMFATEAKHKGLQLTMIDRKYGWIMLAASEQADSIYTSLKSNDARQTELAKQLIAL